MQTDSLRSGLNKLNCFIFLLALQHAQEILTGWNIWSALLAKSERCRCVCGGTKRASCKHLTQTRVTINSMAAFFKGY